MKLSLPLIVLAALLGFCAADAAAQGAKITDDTVVARVGGAAITRKALLKHLARYYGKAGLEQLIDRSILRQEAARLGVQLADADVDSRAAELKKQAGANFVRALEAEGISEETWRDRIRYLALSEKVRDRKWPVTDDDLVRLSVRYARVLTEQQAKDIIREAKSGVSFELLALQRSYDKENNGLVQPDPFLRVENTPFFRWADQAGLRVGQISEPIPSDRYHLVLKLEKRLEPSTLKPQEREQAVDRIKGFRLGALLPLARQRLYRIEHLASADGEGALAAATELAKVTPLPAAGRTEANPEIVNGKATAAHLLAYFGQLGVNQLVERSIMDQEAARLRVPVSDAQIAARAAALEKKLGKQALQARLASEGLSDQTWRDRLKYEALAENVIAAKFPARPEELERFTARFIQAQSLQDAQRIIQAARMGADFGQLIKQRSRDQTADGYVQPRPFLRADNPTFFDAIKKANTAPGQVVPAPVQLGRSAIVLRVEQRHPPESMTPQERGEATRRLNLPRIAELLEQNRKGFKVEYPASIKALVDDARDSGE